MTTSTSTSAAPCWQPEYERMDREALEQLQLERLAVVPRGVVETHLGGDLDALRGEVFAAEQRGVLRAVPVDAAE